MALHDQKHRETQAKPKRENSEDGMALLSNRQAAARLGVQPQTLRKWRLEGRGPVFVRLGKHLRSRVGYRASDVESWLEERTFCSTADETVRREQH
jgi:predicted DNA-binding transcriptional regulator AlpA